MDEIQLKTYCKICGFRDLHDVKLDIRDGVVKAIILECPKCGRTIPFVRISKVLKVILDVEL